VNTNDDNIKKDRKIGMNATISNN